MTRHRLRARTRRTRLLAGLFVVTLATISGLTACSSETSPTPTTATATRSVTVTVAPPPTSSESGSASPTTQVDGSACRAAELTGAVEPSAGGGAAGSVVVDLVLTDSGHRTCILHGYPGVSFVGDGNGTQIGASARRAAGTSSSTVRLAPGRSATATLQIAQAGNYDSATCRPTPVDGLRVYPPNDTTALFVRYTAPTGCRSDQVSLLTVGPMTH